MKDIAIQIIRVLAMIYIVIYHSLCYYGVWKNELCSEFTYPYLYIILSLMQLSLMSFVFISGLLYAQIYRTGRYSDTRTLAKKKLSRLLLPYLGWGLILVMLFPTVHSIWELSYGISHLWFLSVLVVLFAFIIMLRKYVLNPYVIGILFVLSIIESFYHYRITPFIPPYFTLRESIFYLPAFLWGIFCVVFQLPEKINKWPKGVFYPALIFLLLFTGLNIYDETLPLRYYYFRILEYVLLLFIYTFLRYKIRLEGVCPAVDHMSRHSMAIYILHHIIIWVALLYIPPVKPFMDRHYIIAPLILFTVVFLMSWGLSVLMNRNAVLRKLLGS